MCVLLASTYTHLETVDLVSSSIIIDNVWRRRVCVCVCARVSVCGYVYNNYSVSRHKYVGGDRMLAISINKLECNNVRSLCGGCRSDVSEDEMDEDDIQKIIIVTQANASYRKHPGGDRTSNFITRTKITSDLAQAINDGLYFYEQDLYSDEISEPIHSSRNVSENKNIDNNIRGGGVRI